MNRMKFFRIKTVVTNSNFTKGFIDTAYGVNSKTIYPPVSVNEFKPKRKQNVICYVGRFSELTQHKRQDVLIEVFKAFYKKNKSWKLVLAGGVEVGNNGLTDKLEKLAKGYPVEVLESPSFAEVKTLMGLSKMFWSASGYGVDENINPKKVEHFGITVVEAMAAKAIPLVINKGGHKEIVSDGTDGYLWNKKSELLEVAERLSSDATLVREVSIKAQHKSKEFSDERFSESFSEII
jgi:glycosyltransferase involved in cell wall biosynthesis